MFITKSRHEREVAFLTKQINDAAELVKDVEPNRRLWLSDRVGIIIAERDDWEAKFKKAITDLEGEIRDRKMAQYDLALARLEVEALRPGHEANERRLKRDREQKAAKRAASR